MIYGGVGLGKTHLIQSIGNKISKNKDPGPLAGVPVGIKDLVCSKGIKTVSGSYFYKDFVPEEDDVSVERLINAGAIVLGKTNVPEFGYSGVGHNPVFETTRNPWNTDLTPGGSSAGSCASVITPLRLHKGANIIVNATCASPKLHHSQFPARPLVPTTPAT